MATFFLDLESGSDAADGTSFANRVLTWAKAASLAAAGDTVKVKASVGPVAMSKNATWVNRSYKLTLSGAVNADIDTGESAWTASANVTCTTSTTRKEGATSSSIAVGSSFTTGLAAYKAMSSTDYSGYEQISFWIQQTSGTLGAAASCSIKLCSDAVGATPVDTLDIPAIPALNVWVPVVINKGAALGNAIQSVALYVNTDNAAQTFLIDNMIAVKASGNADELHHKMLIGKLNSLGGGGNDSQAWHAIRSIRSTVIHLDTSYANGPATDVPACINSSATETAYTFAPSFAPTTVANADNTCVWPGIPGSSITISGGWDRTNMTSQSGYTIFAHPNGNSVQGLAWIGTAFDLTKVSFARFGGSSTIQGVLSATGTLAMIGTGALSISGDSLTFTVQYVSCTVGLTVSGPGGSFTLLCSTPTQSLSVNLGVTATLASGSSVAGVNVTSGQGYLVYGGVTYGGLSAGGGSGLTASETRDALGLASANLDTQLSGINSKTTNLPSDPADASVIAGLIGSLNNVSLSGILASGDVDGYTLEESLKLMLASLAGKLSGANGATTTIRAADDSKARITASVDATGRTAVTLDATG